MLFLLFRYNVAVVEAFVHQRRFFSLEVQQGVEQQLPGAGACEPESQLSPITSQIYAATSLWANHNGPEETNGNEASLLLANQERGVADSNSSGGKMFYLRVFFPIIRIISVTHSQPKPSKYYNCNNIKTLHFFSQKLSPNLNKNKKNSELQTFITTNAFTNAFL